MSDTPSHPTDALTPADMLEALFADLVMRQIAELLPENYRGIYAEGMNIPKPKDV